MRMAKNLENNIVFSPSWITSQYFARVFESKNKILSGEKGIGKSFSFLIYDYFSAFMRQYLMGTS